ncbi:MAG: YfhO family protein [Patescibacteria group bacterium]
MKRKEIVWLILILGLISTLFFYKTVFGRQAPFPGDLLIAEYKPWQAASYLGYNPGSYPHKAQYPDTLRQLYPWRTLAIKLLKEGKLPLWNPYNFSGSPLLANFQAAVFYPLNIFYFMLSQIDAWTIQVVLQPVLAIFFTYLYGRTIRLTILASLLTAISYGLSGFMSVWLEYNSVGQVILWLPLMLLVIEKLGEKRVSPLFMVVLTMTTAIAIFAGHPQVAFYLIFFSAIYALFRLKERKRRLLTLGLLLLGIGASGVQLIPGLELIWQSARSPHEFTTLFSKILIQPWQLLMLPFPNIFGNPTTRTYWLSDTYVGKVTTIGLVPLFFLPAALRRKDALTRFYLIAAVTILVLVTANPLTYLLYKLPLPFLSSSSPTLMVFLMTFSLSILSGLGFDFWIVEKHSLKKLLWRIAQVGLILLSIWLTTKIPLFPNLVKHGGVGQRALLYAGILTTATIIFFAVFICLPRLKRAALIALLLLQTFDLFFFFQRFNPFVPKELVFPPHEILRQLQLTGVNRYWGYGTAAIPANFATQYQIFSPEGYDPLYPRWYGELIHAAGGKLLTRFTGETRSDAAVLPGFGEDGFTNPYRQRLLNALNVRYILDRTENGSTQKTFPADLFTSVYHENDWRILENRKAAARVYLVSDVITYQTADEFERIFFSPQFNPASAVLLEETLPVTSSLDPQASAQLISYGENQLRVRTESKSPAVLVVTDTYYPGWQAQIDGKPTRIYRANWALRAVGVAAGVHEIELRYQPVSFSTGLVISMISILLLTILVWYRHRLL